MTGKQRAMLYTLAINTGLRAGELVSLTWNSLNLNDSEPFLIVEAAYSKHRKKDELPLRPDIANLFKNWKTELQAQDSDKLFATFDAKKGAKLIKKDLNEAKIEYRDNSGRVVDFHSLRHTFITNLTRGGVSPRVAQSLARHSTITLTMDRYSHVNCSTERAALNMLPEIEIGKQIVLKTGTDDLPVNVDKKTDTKTDEKTAKTAYLARQGMSQIGNEINKINGAILVNGQEYSSLSKKGLDTNKQNISDVCTTQNGEGEIRTRGTSVHRYDGLANRCLQPLGHLSKTFIYKDLWL